ncbi:hypothetical protein ACFL2J_06670 [Candidatus Omnitrophota bacterium]
MNRKFYMDNKDKFQKKVQPEVKLDDFGRIEKPKAKFELGEQVWFEGRKWEVADIDRSQFSVVYALWILKGGKIIEELKDSRSLGKWVPERLLAKEA